MEGADPAQISVTLDIPDEIVESIISGFRKIGMVDGNSLTAWEKRQPYREDSSAERTRKYRDRNKHTVTHGDARDARDEIVTQSDAVTASRGRRRDGDETEIKPVVLGKVVELSKPELVTDEGSTEPRNRKSEVNGTSRKSVPSQSPSVPAPHEDPARFNRMAGALHSYMCMEGTAFQRKFKDPDDGIVSRCLDAVGNTPLEDVGAFLHDRYANYEQSPRHPKGPRKYSWFEVVLKTQFSPNGKDHS